MPASQAKYTVMIPVKDNLGNPLGDIATAAHQWLWQATGNEGSYIEGPKKGNWRDHPQEDFNHLITVAQDTPEMDSHIKQLAMEIARGANQWGIFITKEGKSGIQSWVIDNPEYQEGQPAEIANVVNPPQHPQTYSNIRDLHRRLGYPPPQFVTVERYLRDFCGA